MKISAFIRAKSAKNNVTDKATIYFRVRDDRTRTDIKAASEHKLIQLRNACPTNIRLPTTVVS